jgi:predicted DNA-binding protein with PD1-like motif
MKYRAAGEQFVLALERGEEVIATLTQFAREQGLAAAFFQGLGAVERVQIGYYDLGTKQYFFRSEPGVFEVASMTGNVALVDGAPFVHCHAVLSRCDESCACIGAHIKEAFVAVTLEVLLQPLRTEVNRTLNDAIGLKLLNL